MIRALCLVLLALFAPCCCAADKHSPTVTTVEAEGEALASLSDAREKAIADALRNAVMKSIGTYIDAVTVGRNYAVVRDEILMKPSGFATLDEVISSTTSGELYKVKVRASVSNRPLAEKLKALGLTRQWKIGVIAADPAVESAISRQLISAGFGVIRQKSLLGDSASGASRGDEKSLKAIGLKYGLDIVVVGGKANADYVDQDDYGGITLYRSRARMNARAYYADTGEVLAEISEAADGLDQTKELSIKASLKKVGERVGSSMADEVITAPADLTGFMSIKITGFKGIMAANKLEAAIGELPGVMQVKRQRYSSGTLELNVSLKSDYREDLPDLIEKCPVGKKFGLVIETASKTYVEGRVTKL